MYDSGDFFGEKVTVTIAEVPEIELQKLKISVLSPAFQ